MSYELEELKYKTFDEDEYDKSEKRIFCLAKVIASLLAAFLVITAVCAVISYFQAPLVTDKRFTAGYPNRYELQLDGDDWIEVTEQEYADSRINGHFQR